MLGGRACSSGPACKCRGVLVMGTEFASVTRGVKGSRYRLRLYI